jgi:precorrin-3B synthase
MARDGGICRVRLAGGELTSAQARAIAASSVRHATGVLEATNRSNLQIRGVRNIGNEEHTALTQALFGAGLGPGTPGADEVRNLMLSPTAGIDAHALLDTRVLARSLLARLERDFAAIADDIAQPGLSPKFAIQIDGGEALAMLDHHHDIWFAALPDTVKRACSDADERAGAETDPDAGVDSGSRIDRRAHDHPPPSAPLMAFGLAGTVPVTNREHAALGAVYPDQIPDLAAALIHVFLTHGRPDDTRMRDVLRHTDHNAFLDAVQALVPFPVLRAPAISEWRRGAAEPLRRFGACAQTAPEPRRHVGAQFVLGRLNSSILHSLAGLADTHGDGTLRLTPWQGVLLPNVPEHATAAVLSAFESLGLVIDPRQPLGAMIACTGSDGCEKSLAQTKADGHALASHLPASLTQALDIHLSGCTRQCAAGRPVTYTLLAREPGRYDLHHHADGHDAVLLAEQISIEQAAARMLQRLPPPVQPPELPIHLILTSHA